MNKQSPAQLPREEHPSLRPRKLAEALRANLKRRKQASSPDTSEHNEEKE